MAAWLLAYGTAYSVSGLDFYEWYCVPPLPVLGVLAAVGSMRLAGLFPGRLGIVAAGAVVVVLLAGVWIPRHDLVRRNRLYLDSVERARVEVGRWLRANTSPSASVLTGAVGHIGHQADRRIVDAAGLVSAPGTAGDYVAGHDAGTGPQDRFGGSIDFLRQHRLVARVVPAPPFEFLVYKVYEHLATQSELPDGLLFRNSLLPGDERSLAPVGGGLDFTSRDVLPFLGEGWSLPESGFGTWAVARRSFVFAAFDPGMDHTVRLSLMPPALAGESQTLVVGYEHGDLAAFTLAPGWQEIDIHVPGARLDGATSRLSFALGWTAPAGNFAGDSRTLGVAVRSMTLDPPPALSR
jgi:hypothetical protein